MKNSVVYKNNNDFEELLNKAYEAINKYNLYEAQSYINKLANNNIINSKLELLKAKIFMEDNSYEEALKILNDIIKEDNNNYKAYLYRGKIYMSIGEKELAYNDFKNADLLTSNNIEVRYNLARASMSLKRFIEARDVISDLFHYYKDKYLISIFDSCNRYIIDSLLNQSKSLNNKQKIDLAKSYKYIGNINKAIEVLKSIKNIEEEPYALLLVANYLRLLKNYEDSLMYINKYLSLNESENYKAYYIKGLIEENKKEYSKSLESYKKCISENENYKPVYNKITKVLLIYNYYNRAFETCEKAIELNYDKDISLNNKGIIYFYLANYDEALKCFEESICKFPECIDGYLNKSMILRKKEEYIEALSICNNLIKEGNEGVDIITEKALILINMERYEDALRLISKALMIWENSVYVLYIKALCLCKMKDFKEALYIIDNTINNHKSNDVIFISLKIYVFISMNKYNSLIELIRDYFNDYESEDKNLIINFIGKIKYNSSLLKRDFTYEEVVDYLKKIISGIN